jgi:urease accessory protein UreE
MVTHSYTTITGTQPLITLAQAKKTVQSGDDLVYEDDLITEFNESAQHLLRILSIVLLLKGIS